MGAGTSQVLRMLAAPAQAADSLIICGCWERLACVSLVGCGGRSRVGLEWGGVSVFGVIRMLLVAGNVCLVCWLGMRPSSAAPRGPPNRSTRAPAARPLTNKSPHISHNNKGRQSFSDGNRQESE